MGIQTEIFNRSTKYVFELKQYLAGVAQSLQSLLCLGEGC